MQQIPKISNGVNEEKVLDISWGTILKISLVIVFFYVLFLVRDILIWFIFALIISILFNPIIDALEKLRFPRVLAVIFVYVGTFAAISFLISSSIPSFTLEINYFSQVLPQYFEKISPPLRGLGIEAFENMETFLLAVGRILEKMAANIFNVLFSIFGGIFSTVFVLTTAVFLSLEGNVMDEWLPLLFPLKYEPYVSELWSRCKSKVSGWFVSRVLACLFVSLACYIAFLLLNVRYPFSLALLSGILNFIPIVGPIFCGLIIFAVVSFENFLRGIFVLTIFILIQQIENNIITPILSKKFVGLSPAMVLVALVIGGKLWGFLGAILAIPLFGILFEFVKEFLKKRRLRDTVSREKEAQQV